MVTDFHPRWGRVRVSLVRWFSFVALWCNSLVTAQIVHWGNDCCGWGDNRSSQTDVPPDLTDVVAVTGGGRHSLALHGDGRVTGWGDNASGQSEVPPFLSGVVAIARSSPGVRGLRAAHGCRRRQFSTCPRL